MSSSSNSLQESMRNSTDSAPTGSVGSVKSISTNTPLCNGFLIEDEDEFLRCAESNIHPLTLPQEALVFTPDPAEVVCSFKNGDKERKIHCNIELLDAEKEQLKELQKETRRQGKTFTPSIAVMATRFLSRARGESKKAVVLMEKTQAWRQQYFKDGPVTDSQVMEDLKHGIVYFAGRDKYLRPTLVIRPLRIPQQWYKDKCIDKFIRVLIFCMEYMMRYMFIPGRVENNNLIVDLKGLGITQVPIGPLTDVYKVMSHHYIGRVFKFYVVNLSGMLNMMANPIKALLTDRQRQKLCILDKVTDLRQDFALHQLEEDLGGTRPIIKDFFPFPLQAGPFDAGWTKGPNESVVEGCHRCLTEKGARGALWDPKKGKKANTDTEWTEQAYDIFVGCNYAIPPNCPLPAHVREARAAVKAAALAAKQAELDEEREAALSPKTPGGRRVTVNPEGAELASLEHLWKGTPTRPSQRLSVLDPPKLDGQENGLTKTSSTINFEEDPDPDDVPEEAASDSDVEEQKLADLQDDAVPGAGWFCKC